MNLKWLASIFCLSKVSLTYLIAFGGTYLSIARVAPTAALSTGASSREYELDSELLKMPLYLPIYYSSSNHEDIRQAPSFPVHSYLEDIGRHIYNVTGLGV